MPTLVSLADYARRRGVSRPAVSKAIAAGRLRESVHRRGPRPVIDVEVADVEWARNTDTRRVPAERLEDKAEAAQRVDAAAARAAVEESSRAKRRAKAEAETKPEPRQRLVFGEHVDEPVAPPAGANPEDGGLGLAIKRNQHRRAETLATIEEMRAARLAGELVEKAVVRREAYEFGRMLRDAMFAIGPRIGGVFAAMTDPRAIERKHKEEVSIALKRLIERIVADDPRAGEAGGA